MIGNPADLTQRPLQSNCKVFFIDMKHAFVFDTAECLL